jgi:hypothetical protein
MVIHLHSQETLDLMAKFGDIDGNRIATWRRSVGVLC